LHVIESTTAGVRRYVTGLVRGRSAAWDVSVACPALRETHFGDVAFVDEMRDLGVSLHLLPLRRSLGATDLAATRALHRLVKREGYDLIHTHSSKAGFIGRYVARRARVPAIHTPNGLYFLEQRGLKRRFYLTLERLAGRWTDAMIAVSYGERDVMLRHRLVSPERVSVIENGVDTRWIRERAEKDANHIAAQLNLPHDAVLIGGVGRMVNQKDPLTFVRAARRVRQSLSNARFVWVGDGELRDAVERLAQQLDVPLVLTGHLENAWAMLSRFDVFVLPSLYEGLPFTLLEAMALGVPVVAADVVGAHEVLADTSAGWLVPPKDEVALARRIVETLAQPSETQRRVQTARQLVETRFSLERMLSSHQALYARMLQTRRPVIVS
jgi:glycosyltransferase involved in cell wall biosynthesis